MINLIEHARWDQLYNALAGGEPPMIARILILNTLFFILFAIRRSRGVHSMRRDTAIRVQGLLIAANGLILFQDQILSYMRNLT
jgi:hypothetical protein